MQTVICSCMKEHTYITWMNLTMILLCIRRFLRSQGCCLRSRKEVFRLGCLPPMTASRQHRLKSRRNHLHVHFLTPVGVRVDGQWRNWSPKDFPKVIIHYRWKLVEKCYAFTDTSDTFHRTHWLGFYDMQEPRRILSNGQEIISDVRYVMPRRAQVYPDRPLPEA